MPRSVSLVAGSYNVELPNGLAYNATYATTTAGPTVILTDEEWAKVGAGFSEVLVDNGNVGTSVVTVQGASVALVTATTAVDLTTTEALANALKTTVNQIITNLSVPGGALA